MGLEFDINKAMDIMTAYRQQRPEVMDVTTQVFINWTGEIVILENHFNYKSIGKMLSNERFQIGAMKYSFNGK